MQSSFGNTEEKALAPTSSPGEGAQGDYNPSEIEVPLLSLVQGVGDLANKELEDGTILRPGDIVLMRQFIIPQPVGVSIFKHVKYYYQNIEYAPDVRRKEFATEQEVFDAGGNLDFGRKPNEDPDNYVKASRISLAVDIPEELSETVVSIPFEDSFVTPAVWKVSKSAFQAVIPRLNLIEMTLRVKKEPLASKKFALSSDRVTKGNKNYYVPSLREQGKNSPEFVEFLRSIF